MARLLRIECPGAVYHVTSRGNARNNIYENDQDLKAFLNLLSEVVKKCNWHCHAYCLMDNHYHLFIETPDAHLIWYAAANRTTQSDIPLCYYTRHNGSATGLTLQHVGYNDD
jgi:REP element-mobilizing transposase RayT